VKDPVQAVYDALTEKGVQEARNHESPPRRFRASEASNCVRQIYHRLNGDRPAPRKAPSKMVGMAGDVDHDMTRIIMMEAGVPVGGIKFHEDGSQEELLWYRETVEHAGETFEVTARCDGLLQETPQGPCLLEIKGMSGFAFDWLNKAFIKGGHAGALKRIKEKHQSYYDQCHVSMAMAGMTTCYLLVKDRSSANLGLHNPETGERSGIYIEFDPEHYNKILDRFAYVTRKLNEGKPPMPEKTPGSRECGWCEFRYRCHDALERMNKGLEPHIVYPGPQVAEQIGEAKHGD
jgi:hypothetical protein